MSKSSQREVISLHLGQGGIQLGSCIWEQYCKEHGITMNGVRRSKLYKQMERVRKDKQGDYEQVPIDEQMEEKVDPHHAIVEESSVFFTHNNTNDTHSPRAVFVDLEPNVIDDLQYSAFGSLFNPSFLINGKEDAANNYARGRYTIGKEVEDLVQEAVRKNTETCSSVQAFIFSQTVAGGTGSGFGGILAEHLSMHYKKIPKISFAIYPSEYLSNSCVEPYNALLATKDLIEHNDITIVLDNEAGYALCRDKLKIKKPSYFNMNRLVAKAVSSMTCGIRFPGQQQFTVSDLQTNLVPFPKLHFMTSGMSPVITEDDKTQQITEDSITREVFRKDNMFVNYTDWDPETDQYMGISVTYRGNIVGKNINTIVQELKGNEIKLVEWCPTGFKISNIDKLPGILADDRMFPATKTVCMIGNNVAIARPFETRICKKYDLLYSQRAFVHWYVGEGMEEGEFAEAREELELLLRDFQEMMKGGDDNENENENENDVGSDPEL